MAVIGLIPARGGSKGIPRKNLAECAGRPLMHYTIRAARGAPGLGPLYASTDDEEIAEYARSEGVRVPWLRPEELSGDRVPMIEVVRHFLEWYREEEGEPEGILLLQPTSPLRTARHIAEALERYLAERPASLVSVTEVPHRFAPESLMREVDGRLEHRAEERSYTRQEKTTWLARNGPAVLIMSPGTVDRGEPYGAPCIGYRMGRWASVDVDDPEDLKLAEWLLSDER